MQQNQIFKIPNRQIWYWQSKYRYYIIRLQQNLFGEWTTLKSWGGNKNNFGNWKLNTFNSLESALLHIEQELIKRTKKCYRLL